MSLDDQNAFQQSFEFVLSPGTVGDGPTFTVPAAQRLVIEQVSFASLLPPGGKAEHYIVFTTVNGVNGFYHFTPGDNRIQSTTQRVRIYADPQTDVRLFLEYAASGGDGPATLLTSVSGYLVDYPSITSG